MKDLAFLMSCLAALPGFSEAQRYWRALCACRRMFLSGCSTPMGLAAVLWADESALAFEFALVMLKEEQNPLLDKETYKAVEFDRAKADSCNTSVVKPGAAKWGQRSKMGHGLTGGTCSLCATFLCRTECRDQPLPCQLSSWGSYLGMHGHKRGMWCKEGSYRNQEEVAKLKQTGSIFPV